MREKLLIALPFYTGDRPEALRLAQLLADTPPDPLGRIEYFLLARSDAYHDTGVVRELLNSGRVIFHTQKRGVRGHPDAPNGMFRDVVEFAAAVGRARKDDFYSGVFVLEPDFVPTRKTWAKDTVDLWDKTLELGFDVLAPLSGRQPLIFSSDPTFLGHVVRAILSTKNFRAKWPELLLAQPDLKIRRSAAFVETSEKESPAKWPRQSLWVHAPLAKGAGLAKKARQTFDNSDTGAKLE